MNIEITTEMVQTALNYGAAQLFLSGGRAVEQRAAPLRLVASPKRARKAKAAPIAKPAKAVKAKSPKAPRAAKPAKAGAPKGPRKAGAKRDPGALSDLTVKLAEFISANQSLGIEKIAKGMGVPSRELKLPIAKLLASSAIAKSGAKRSTVYYTLRGTSAKVAKSNGAAKPAPVEQAQTDAQA